MANPLFSKTLRLLSAAGIACTVSCAQAADIQAPQHDAALQKPGAAPEKIVFAGGCFWGIEAVFEHVKGVTAAVSGYAGGNAETAHYDIVSAGTTGHAESVEVTYDPAQITPGTLMQVFFAVAHDPTQRDRQGPDTGTQYRSAIFFTTPAQESIARDYIAQLTDAKSFPAKIVTEVTPLEAFYPAESYHQDYARLNPNQPYIVFNDAPKVAHLEKAFPALYRPDAGISK
jgi:peptide-methionine (S)-S-oxide reductase